VVKKLMHINERTWLPSAIPFFLFGFCYYLISPFLSLYFLSDNRLISAAAPYISLSYFDLYYYIDALNIFTFWLIGYWFAQKITRKKASKLDAVALYNHAPPVLFVAFFLLLFFLILKAMMSGASFFSGYSSYDVKIIGPFATMVFVTAFFVNYFSHKRVRHLFFILFLMSSLVLLGFGSRMFFVLGIITITLGYISKNPQLLKEVKLYFIAAIFLVLVLAVGIWRSQSSSVFSIEMFISIFLVEPLFTATSGSLYLENNNGRPYLNLPVDIFASIINFIPTFVFPEKLELINNLTFNPLKESPFGANALIVNMYSNFGFFYPIYFLLIGLFYGFLKVRAYYSFFYKAVYFTVLPLLMFHFFREGFITVFKVMFFNGFIFPAIIVSSIILCFKKTRITNPRG